MADDADTTLSDAQKWIILQYSRLEKISKHLTNFKKDSDSRKTQVYFQKKLEQIEELNAEFAKEHERILCAEIDEEEEYMKEDIADRFEIKYFETYCTVADAFKVSFPPTPQANQQTVASVEIPTQTTSKQIIQVPNLTVPKFSGKIIDWPGFHDNFNRMFNLNKDLNPIQRFHFLKQALPDDRDVDIHQMSMTETNYQIAWELLAKRYHIPRILFMHNMNTLYNLPTLTREKSDDIKRMLNVASVCIAAMEKLNIPIKKCDQWIAHYLTTKLSKETHQAWEYHLGNTIEIPTFNDFETFLNNRLITLDVIENRNTSFQSESGVNQDGKKPYVGKTEKKASSHKQKYSVNIATTDDKQRKKLCYVCQGQHIIRRCPKFLAKNPYDRKEDVDKANVCRNCLGFHHVSKCTSLKNCLDCGQRHHTLLHFPINMQNPTTSNDTSEFHSNNTQLIAASTSQRDQSSKVLLATALIFAHNPHTNRSVVLRALIDQGSEITIISERAVQALQLKRVATRAEICGVGSGNKSQSRFTVSLHLRSQVNKGVDIYVERAYVMDTLSSNLSDKRVTKQSWPHTRDLLLADPTYYQSIDVDLVIGADFFAQIILPDIRIGSSNQPIAQRTVFGWISHCDRVLDTRKRPNSA